MQAIVKIFGNQLVTSLPHDTCSSEEDVVIVQSLSHIRLFVTPQMQHARLLCSLLELLQFLSVESVMLSSHLILCCLLLLLLLIFASIRVFCNESGLHIKWPKYWNFSIGPSNEYSGLISSRMDWFSLLAVQGTLRSLLQHHNSKASVLRRSVFFMAQLSYPS